MLFDLALSFVNLLDLSRELCHAFITKSTYTTSLSHFYTGSRLIHSTIKSRFSFWKYIFTNLIFPQRTWLYKKRERKKNKRKLEHKCSWVQLSSKKEEKGSHAPCKEKRRRDKEKWHHPPSYPLTYLGLWLHDMTLLGSIAWLSKISRTNRPSFDPYL